MKRRSKAGGAPTKGRRRKASKPERRNAQKTAPRSKSSPTSKDTVVARLTHELRETIEQHTATSEILRVISGSPSDLQPVFQAMLKNAVRLCDAKFGNIYRWDGDALHLVATQNVPARLGPSTWALTATSKSANAYIGFLGAHIGDMNHRFVRESCAR